MPVFFNHTRTITSREVKNARVLELHGLWDSHRRDGTPPQASGLLPEAYALCSDDLILIERTEAEDFLHRHYGANVAAQDGFDMTDRRLSEFGGPMARFFGDWYARALDEQAAIYTTHRARNAPTTFNWERLLLPLSSDGGAVDQLLVYSTSMAARQDLLANVIETSHCGVMAIEAVRNAKGSIIDFTITLANPLAAEILESPRTGLIDQRLLKRFPESRESGLFYSLVAVADGAPTMDVNFQRNERWLRITAARTATGLTLTMSDVTVFKQQNEELKREIALRTEAEYELVRLATIDALTGLSNRRHFLDRSEREFNRAARSKAPVSLLYFDVDHFKSVNDTYGHSAGDEVLKMVATTLNEAVRPYDVVGRLGGEEFAVVLPNTNAEEAHIVGERVRSMLAAKSTPIDDGREIAVTISGGYALAGPDETLDAVIARADAALYDAKRGGRNQIRQAA